MGPAHIVKALRYNQAYMLRSWTDWKRLGESRNHAKAANKRRSLTRQSRCVGQPPLRAGSADKRAHATQNNRTDRETPANRHTPPVCRGFYSQRDLPRLARTANGSAGTRDRSRNRVRTAGSGRNPSRSGIRRPDTCARIRGGISDTCGTYARIRSSNLPFHTPPFLVKQLFTMYGMRKAARACSLDHVF